MCDNDDICPVNFSMTKLNFIKKKTAQESRPNLENREIVIWISKEIDSYIFNKWSTKYCEKLKFSLISDTYAFEFDKINDFFIDFWYINIVLNIRLKKNEH